ncbi:MAG: hypothetical protein HC912_05080 [Saprospiraceae bacterium]|nr:hypothetical protein [Saprospiraceae bacterium]
MPVFLRFLLQYADNDYVHQLILAAFCQFFQRKVLDYPDAKQYDIHFTGSIAFYFKDKLHLVAQSFGLLLGKIEKTPMSGLIDYHLTQ